MTSRSLAILAVLLIVVGCERPDDLNEMENHGRVKPYEPVPFFPDAQSARPLPPGTVARSDGPFIADPVLATGKAADGTLATTSPVPVTRDLLLRGQARFNIYCSPCHGYTGDGNGMVAQRGFVPPPSFHTDPFRAKPVGHIVDVIANGWGAMFSYNDRVKPEDRWAIAAYVRALQLSQHAPVNRLSEDDRQHLAAATTAGGVP